MNNGTPPAPVLVGGDSFSGHPQLGARGVAQPAARQIRLTAPQVAKNLINRTLTINWANLAGRNARSGRGEVVLIEEKLGVTVTEIIKANRN